MKTDKEYSGCEALKLEVGEVVRFEDFIVRYTDTPFGVGALYSFADKEGNVIRKCFAQGGMESFLEKNKDTKSIVLKKRIKDGEFSYNVWAKE